MKDVNATVIINLEGKSEHDLFRNLDYSRRKNIKKAERSELSYEETDLDSDKKKCYNLYSKVLFEGGSSPISYLDWRKIVRDENWKIFLVKKNRKTIGYFSVMEIDKRFYNLDSDEKGLRPRVFASKNEYQKYRVNDFIYWSCITYALKNGYNFIDLGGHQINPRGHLKGVNKFKEKWGGEIFHFYLDYPLRVAISRKLIRNVGFLWDLHHFVKKLKVISQKNIHVENIKNYDNEGSLDHYSGLSALSEIEKKVIKNHLNGKILDLGCGCGRTTKYLFDKGFDVIGVDIVKSMIDKAKKVYPNISFEQGDACELKFKKDYFDSVLFSFNGIDYIFPESKRIEAIKQIERVLKPGGLFIFCSHNPKALFFRFRPSFWIRNLKRMKLFSRYKVETNKVGTYHTYYASMKKQINLIEKNSGLRFVKIYRMGLSELHPYYVFKKL